MAGVLNAEIKEINAEIEKIMRYIDSPILSVPGIGFINGAMILAEIGDFSRFSSPDKILAFAGISLSSHQSGKSVSGHVLGKTRIPLSSLCIDQCHETRLPTRTVQVISAEKAGRTSL